MRTREGRAIKLEGNPEHPVNAGKLCSRGQAALQVALQSGPDPGPDGAARPTGGHGRSRWDEAIDRAGRQGERGRRQGRRHLRRRAGNLLRSPGRVDRGPGRHGGALPAVRPRADRAAANRRVFGVDALPAHDFASARYILSFGADFLETWLAPVENQRGFAAVARVSRRRRCPATWRSRPGCPSPGMNADEWFAIVPGTEATIALAMAKVILAERSSAPPTPGLRGMLAAYTPERWPQETGLTGRADQAAGPGVRVGRAEPGGGRRHRQPARRAPRRSAPRSTSSTTWPATSARRSVSAPISSRGDGYAALPRSSGSMDGGPGRRAPGARGQPGLRPAEELAALRRRWRKVPFKVSTVAGSRRDRRALRSRSCRSHHALERWDDLRPRAGVHGADAAGHGAGVRHAAGGRRAAARWPRRRAARSPASAAPCDEHLKAQWQACGPEPRASAIPGLLARARWRGAGVYDAAPAPTGGAPGVRGAAGGGRLARVHGEGEFLFAPSASPMLYDGRGANKPWLLENPDPVTKITWQSWVEIHPETAAELDIAEGEILRLTSPSGSHRGAGVPLSRRASRRGRGAAGLGHTDYGAYATGPRRQRARPAAAPGDGGFLPYVSTRVTLEKTGGYQKVAKTEGNTRQLGRGIAEAMPLAAARKGLTLEEAHHEAAGGPSPRDQHRRAKLEAIAGFARRSKAAEAQGNYAGDHPQWGMAIDLAKLHRLLGLRHGLLRGEQHSRPWASRRCCAGREMTWMRIERYCEGGEERRAAGGPVRPDALPALRQRALRAGLPGLRGLSHARTGSTARSTTGASAPATAPTTAPTRCGTSTGSPTTRRRSRSRSISSSTPT